MESDLVPTGRKIVIARYSVLKVLFLDYAAAVVWYFSANMVWRHFVGGEPWPTAGFNLVPYYHHTWAPGILMVFVTFPLCAPFLLHLFCAVVFNGAAAIYAKDGWLVCHSPLMGRIRVEDIDDTRIETQTALSPRGVTMSRNRLVIQSRLGQCRKVSEVWLSCSLEDAAQAIKEEIARESAGSRHGAASSAFPLDAGSIAPTSGRRRPV
jgi:hypothetical protein